MKTKLQILTAIVVFVSLATAFAQNRVGLPSGVVTIDPQTGMPVPTESEWMDPNWKDPVKVIAAVNFPNGLPISEAVHYLSDQFSNAFDIIMPTSYPTPDGSGIEPGGYPVTLQLRNVTASEIFRAMNLEFEIERTPLHWELKMNGTRPTAVLNVVPGLIPSAPQSKRMVFYLGDLNGIPLDEIMHTITKVWEVAGVMPSSLSGHLEVYAPAQLLIVNGTPDQIDLTQQTLGALKLKAESEALKQTPQTKATTSKAETSGSSK